MSQHIEIEESNLLKKISHDEFKAFAKEQIAKEGFYKRVYSIVLLLTGFSFFAGVGYGLSLSIFNGQNFYFIQLGLGIIFCFTFLIILHEILHGIAYKLAGAKKIYFGAIISKFIFFAACDQEKFNGIKFRFIALFPFVMVLIVGSSYLLLYPEYFLFTVTILFFHTLFCGGDFAVLNFMEQYDLSRVYTYDSRKERETYFYRS